MKNKSRMLKWNALLGVALVTGLILSLRAEDKEAPAAVEVNGTRLEASELDEMVSLRMEAMQGRIPPAEIDSMRPKLRAQLTEQFVIQSLLTSATEASGIEVDEAKLAETVAKTKATLPADMSFEQLCKIQGIDEAGFRDRIRLQLCVDKIIDERAGGTVEATEQEIVEFYKKEEARMSVPETVRARHILIKFDEGDDAEAKTAKLGEIQAIRKEILDGTDFATVAQSKSHCPSAQSGGDLGTFGRGQMVKPFEDAAFGQDVGEIGDVVESEFGYHIIEVLEQNQAKTRSLEDVRDDIAQYLEYQKRGDALQAYVTELKEQATIIYPPNDFAAP